MTAVTFPLRLPRLAFAICGWRWQNDLHEIKTNFRKKGHLTFFNVFVQDFNFM